MPERPLFKEIHPDTNSLPVCSNWKACCKLAIAIAWHGRIGEFTVESSLVGQHQEQVLGHGLLIVKFMVATSSAARNDAPFKPIERLHASFCHGNGGHFGLLYMHQSGGCQAVTKLLLCCDNYALFQELWIHWIALRLCRSNPLETIFTAYGRCNGLWGKVMGESESPPYL